MWRKGGVERERLGEEKVKEGAGEAGESGNLPMSDVAVASQNGVSQA